MKSLLSIRITNRFICSCGSKHHTQWHLLIEPAPAETLKWRISYSPELYAAGVTGRKSSWLVGKLNLVLFLALIFWVSKRVNYNSNPALTIDTTLYMFHILTTAQQLNIYLQVFSQERLKASWIMTMYMTFHYVIEFLVLK